MNSICTLYLFLIIFLKYLNTIWNYIQITSRTTTNTVISFLQSLVQLQIQIVAFRSIKYKYK